jgi:hypothetical protein
MFDNRRGKLARFLATDPGAFGSSMLSAYLAEAWVTLRDNSCAIFWWVASIGRVFWANCLSSGR